MRRCRPCALVALHLAALGAASEVAAASRSANLSVVATVARSCVSAPQSLEVTCTKGTVTQVQVTPVTATGASRGSFFGVAGTRGALATEAPFAEKAAPAPFVTSGTAGNGNGVLSAPADDGASETFLVTVNF